jgi:hypothetical protein
VGCGRSPRADSAFLAPLRKEIRDLVGNLQTLKIGDSLHFVRATVDEMRSFGESDPEFQNPAQQVVGVPLEKFLLVPALPGEQARKHARRSFISMNWPPLQWLRNLEASLSIQAERLKASRHFREDHPPPDFIEAKKRLFRALVSSSCRRFLFVAGCSLRRTETVKPVGDLPCLVVVKELIGPDWNVRCVNSSTVSSSSRVVYIAEASCAGLLK